MSQLSIESSAVQSYLGNLQTAINRTAGNSATCKTLCITVVSALMVFAYEKNRPDSIGMSVIPITLFFVLDAYYLGIERRFRVIYDTFLHRLHARTAVAEDLFIMTTDTTSKTVLASTVDAALSISVWPFYLFVGLMLVILRTWIF